VVNKDSQFIGDFCKKAFIVDTTMDDRRKEPAIYSTTAAIDSLIQAWKKYFWKSYMRKLEKTYLIDD